MSEQASKLMDEDDDLRIKIGSYFKFKIYNICLFKLFWLIILKLNRDTQLGELILDRVPSFFTSFYLFHHLVLDHITYLQARKSNTNEAWGASGAKMGNGSYRDRGKIGRIPRSLGPVYKSSVSSCDFSSVWKSWSLEAEALDERNPSCLPQGPLRWCKTWASLTYREIKQRKLWSYESP